MKKIMIRVMALGCAVLMLGSVLAGCGKKGGDKKGGNNGADDAVVVMESEHFSISNPMMSFFFREAFMNTYQSYLSYFGSEMMGYIGLDPSSPLKDQSFTMGEEEGVETWYDYFLKMAKEQAETCLRYREAAEEAGIALEDSDREAVDGIIENLRSSAEEAGVTTEEYYENLLGKGVTEEVLRECLELESYASKYINSVTDAVDVSEDALNTVYEANPLNYETVSYMSYTFKVSDLLKEDEPEEAADEEDADTETPAEDTAEDPAAREEALAKIKASADELAATDGEEAFHEYIYNYEVDVLGNDESSAETVATYSLTEGAGYTEELEASKWAFSAKAGETKIEADDEAGTVTVYLLVKEHARDESSETRSIRHILFGKDDFDDAAAKSKEVYDKWVEEGATLDGFIALVPEYSTDPGSKDNGGLYEGVRKGQMVDEFNDWMFDENRKDGDHGLIETDYGWHIMYMESVGEPAWMTMIKNELKTKAYEDNLNELKEKYQITVHEDLMDVPDVAEPAPADTAPDTEPATAPADTTPADAPATGEAPGDEN